MAESDYSSKEILLSELIDALYEELEFENPCIPEVERKLLVRLMVCDIYNRGDHVLRFDSLMADPFERISGGRSPSKGRIKDREITVH